MGHLPLLEPKSNLDGLRAAWRHYRHYSVAE